VNLISISSTVIPAEAIVIVSNWAKDPKIAYKTINARADSVDTAPSFGKRS
jgi:putative SOS response-associated peptidase YedK